MGNRPCRPPVPHGTIRAMPYMDGGTRVLWRPWPPHAGGLRALKCQQIAAVCQGDALCGMEEQWLGEVAVQ